MVVKGLTPGPSLPHVGPESIFIFTVKRPIPLNMGKLCDSFHPLTEYEDNDVVPPSGPRLFSCSLLKHTLDPTIMPWEAKDT